MSLDVEICRKILKDETNRQMLCLLGEKDVLTSVELMDALNVTPRLFDYHLRCLTDFVAKTADDKYMLSEKGKQAYELLGKGVFERVGMSRRRKIAWIVGFVSCFVCAFVYWQIFNVTFARFLSMLVLTLIILGFSFGFSVKPKLSGRLLYIGMGACFLGLLLFLFTMLLRGESYFAMFPPGSTGDNILAVLSFVVCYIVGGVVGELIGKKMQYRWPPHFSL